MRSKLSTELFSSTYAVPLLVFLAGALLLVAIFRRSGWVVFLWIPIVCWSGLLSFIALALLVFGLNPPSGQGGGMPGQFILSAAFVVAPFVIVFLIALFLRPHRAALTARSIVLSLLLACCLSATPFLLPRPHAMRVQLRALDTAGIPVPDASVTYSVFGGKGSNFDGQGHTDAAGSFTLVLYPSEWGTVTVSASVGTAELRYQEWTEIMVGGRHNGIRFISASDTIRLEPEIGYVNGRTIAANSHEILDVHLQPH
jgi:hypothetical protein